MTKADDMLKMFDDLNNVTEEKSRDRIVRSPFNYPGGKSKSIHEIVHEIDSPFRQSCALQHNGDARSQSPEDGSKPCPNH